MHQRYSRLIKKDNKLTSARYEILDILISSTLHQTAAEIYQKLRDLSHKRGIATVYRTLELFESLNIVEVLMKDHTKYFKIVNPNHQNHIHFICSVCKRIIEYDDPEILEFNRKLKEYITHLYCHQITEHLSLTGICNNCMALDKKEGN
ncbi:MAG: transcriptional repressor [Clostridiales bacterium]|nr:transcriptional repressor [Clostridiales bacterium]